MVVTRIGQYRLMGVALGAKTVTSGFKLNLE